MLKIKIKISKIILMDSCGKNPILKLIDRRDIRWIFSAILLLIQEKSEESMDEHAKEILETQRAQAAEAQKAEI